MPPEMLERNPWSDSTKKAVKNWVRENVGMKGEDAILWGKWEEENLEYERLEEGTCPCPRPYWTEKQMKKRGKPKRKKIKMDHQEECNNGENEEVEQGGSGELEEKTQRSTEKDGDDKCTKRENESTQNKPSQKELRKIIEERRELWRIKKAKRDKNKKSRERRKKEQEEEMIRKGKAKTMSQHTLRRWTKGGDGLEGGHEGAPEGKNRRRGRTRGVKKGIG